MLTAEAHDDYLELLNPAQRKAAEYGYRVVVAENGLPAVSLPVTVTSKLVSTARSLPATETLKVLPAPTVPL